MSNATISTIALLLCLAPGVLHSVEVSLPMLSRWIVSDVLLFLGHHPGVTRHGRNVGIVFGPFRAIAAVLNVVACSASLPSWCLPAVRSGGRHGT